MLKSETAQVLGMYVDAPVLVLQGTYGGKIRVDV